MLVLNNFSKRNFKTLKFLKVNVPIIIGFDKFNLLTAYSFIIPLSGSGAVKRICDVKPFFLYGSTSRYSDKSLFSS